MKKGTGPNFSWPNLGLALGSALLLILAFPAFNQPWCAWVALVPWLLMLRDRRPGPAFGWSWLVGFGFFLGSIWWMVRLSAFAGPMAIVGWLALCAVLALHFGTFGTLASTVLRRGTRERRQASVPVPRPPSPVPGLLFLPCAWVALEYARSHLLTGFGWNLLAYSQASWLPLIQVADLTGAWGVSFIIVLVNVALARAVRDVSLFRHRVRPAKKGNVPAFGGYAAAPQAAVAAAVVLAALAYGLWRLPHVGGPRTVRVAVVQGNIQQEQKWDEAYRADILQRYATLTRQAAGASPDLIVWPETSVPGFLGLDEPLTQSLLSLNRAVGVPMLVGAPHAHLDGARWQPTNGAALLQAGAIRQWYDKVHLVPFGEFIPFEGTLPWLRDLFPPIGEFLPGRDYTVFATSVRSWESGVVSPNSQLSTPNSQLTFSVLICFEDLFPDLARRFVQRGAGLLLVITNDAWFGPTAAAYQHAQASTFRAIELRVPVARAANTGWSGCIDASGRWRGSVRDAAGTELFVPGIHACDLPTPGPAGAGGVAGTPYLRWGDWFAWLCIGLTAAGLLDTLRRLPYNQGLQRGERPVPRRAAR